ncbi:amino acid adenylation domain-containing protein [Streptomyces sp. NBC_00525]|uniref:amino acid adenylation domain-containing protein n=1 Tax=Streptomyces sp. NBC_00525 TaxID=2903660 RepID=UPI002E7FFC11|nr:amino acid adenylation domain-containing protein [Streptomyces sp. NBC_00525]WUC95721.1 amino acid adenylation domain-containing protein [Streptomyces sp. NBC_00525]
MSVTESYRLSTQQRWHWSHAQDDRVTARLRTAAPLDRARAERALAAVVARHEALRLRVGDLTGTGMPIQVVDEEAVPHLRAPEEDAGEAPVTVTLAADLLTVDASVLLADRESLALLLEEFAAYYLGTPPAEDPDRIQFLDVVEWQADESSGDVPAEPGAVTSVVLPHQGTGPTDQTVECPLPDSEGDPEPRVLGAWLRALGRYLDEEAESVTIAWYDSGRHPDGTTGVIGPLGCFVAVDLHRGADDTALGTSLAEARARSLRVTPLDRPAAAGFVMYSSSRTEALTALGAEPVSVHGPVPETGLHLECVVGDGRLCLTLHSDSDTGPVAGRMLLESVVAELAGGGAGPTEKQVLDRWAGQAGAYAEQTLVTLLDEAFAAAPEGGAAVIAPDATLSFGELDRAADAIAGRLRERGVRPGDRVAVLGERSASTVAAFVGVLRAGGVYVPLDPAHPTAWLVAQARSVDAALVTGAPDGAALTALAAHLPTLPLDGSEPAACHERVRVDPQDAAYIIFTSGSTGAARPVVVEHRNAACLYTALQRTVYADAPEGLRVAVNASLGFDASVKQLLQLAAGRTLCLVDEETRRDVPALLNRLAEHRVGVLDCTPSHLRLILDGREPGQRLPELLLVGGEPVDETLWQEIAGLDGVRAVNLYGPTECTVDTTWASVEGADTPSIGRPLPGLRVHVMDPAGRPVPPGCEGELVVAGPQVARGYWADEEATAARFTEVEGVRAYRTGDRVRFLDDGRLDCLGRLDDQVKINGHRLEPGEVTAVLRSHPALANAYVGRRPATPGSATASDRLAAFVVPRPEATAGLLDGIAGVNPHETRYLFDEIFVQRTYLRGGITLREGAVVLDVGANIGMFARFVDATCPGVRILAFEPLPEPFALLEKNLQGSRSRVELFPVGLSDEAGSASFTVYPGYSMMSGLAAYADPAAEISVVRRFLTNRRDEALFGEVSDVLADRFAPETAQVTLRRLSDVLAETDVTRVDLLKIDVQRAEFDVLRGIDAADLARVEQVALEVHDDTGREPDGRVAQIEEYLRSHGFDVVTEQDELLAGTDRYAVYAVRPRYREDTRAVAEPPLAVPDAALLRQWVAQRLPEPFVPADIVFLDELPLTANGKIDRNALPVPGRQDRVVTAPTTATERALLAVWEEVLGRTGIGIDDDFFALGGDSIRAIRLRAVAGRAGLRFPLRTVFRAVTIRALAAEIAGQEPAAEPAVPEHTAYDLIDPADRERLPDGVVDAYPMTALQLAMVFHAETYPDSGGYHVVTVVTVRGEWAPEALRTAAARIAARHEVLRTSFDLAEYRTPMQLVHEHVEIPCRTEDLTGLTEAGRDDRITALVAAEEAAHFDWRAPMLRLTALRTGPDTFELIQTHFHGVLDGLSLQLMTEELLAEYDRCRLGRQVTPPPAQPYRRFVEAELAAQSDEAARRFWREAVADMEPLLLADAGRPRMSRALVIDYDDVPAEQFARAASAARVPVKSLLLTAHVRALAMATARTNVVTGLVMNGRVGEEGGDRTLGLFLNTVPVAATAADEPARLWRAEQSLIGHHALPLVDIQRCGTGAPLFDTFFNFVQFEPSGTPDGTRVIGERDHVIDVGFACATHAEIAGDRLRVTIQYDPDLVRADRLDAYAGTLRAELDATIALSHTVEGPR